MKLNLLVLRCANIDDSRKFYEQFGLTLTKEKHGKGVEHYSCCIESVVFEIYPLVKGQLACNSRLGFRVQNIEQLITKIEIHSQYEFNGKIIYIAVDPDGRKVEIS